MLKCLLSACVLGLVLSAGSGYEWDHRIVNGKPVTIEEVPYQVAVGNSSAFWCGGSIVSQRIIITAAHCFLDHDITTESFIAFVGMTTTDEIKLSMLKAVAEVIIHPKYDTSTHNYDIAIIKLKEDLIYNSKVQPVQLPSFQESVPIGSLAFASGWGMLYDNGPSPKQLQGVEIQLRSGSDCSKFGNFDSVYMMCAGSLDGSVDTCQGDSGGPLVYNGVLWGVTSYGHGCAVPEYPGVYANVANLRDFIKDIANL